MLLLPALLPVEPGDALRMLEELKKIRTVSSSSHNISFKYFNKDT